MKILIVDDNKSITDALSKFLKIKGYMCTVANDGKKGLSICLSQKFDLIFLDLSMPEFPGSAFIEALEKAGKINDQRIIILTAMPLGVVNIENCMKNGLVQALEKPAGLDLILKTVETMTRSL
jgi:two-component system OmpR family response regulator